MNKFRYKALGLIFFCSVALFSLSGCSPILELNQKYARDSITVNYGDVVSTDIGEYVNLDALSQKDQQYVRKHSAVVYRGKKVSGEEYDQPGNYPLTIYYNNQVYRKYQVNVRDQN